MPDSPSNELPDIDAYFRSNLKGYRERAHLTQEQLAQRLSDIGFSFRQQTIQKIEQGTRGVSLREALAISKALNLPELDALLAPPVNDRLSYLMNELLEAQSALWSAHNKFFDIQNHIAQFIDEDPSSVDQSVIDTSLAKTSISTLRHRLRLTGPIDTKGYGKQQTSLLELYDGERFMPDYTAELGNQLRDSHKDGVD
ncbi:helix-turn-helix transcriptional regulator [Haematomicrobium sanguinis]|uniref:helix-turn-helix transcriptional regulator n=1 Tax=Haematomicrobium sanguinis TaxID=479106 RepID=UPI0005544960|nr:helix-turn-helix transcriptional regulator [Haematomicrobium sanguinis]